MKTKYETMPSYMEKYYKPIPREDLNKPLPGDEEINQFCLFGFGITCVITFLVMMPW